MGSKLFVAIVLISIDGRFQGWFDLVVLRRALREAINAFLATLARYTLADLMEPRQVLSKILQINLAVPGSKLGSAPGRPTPPR